MTGPTPSDDVNCLCATAATTVPCSFAYRVDCETDFANPLGSTIYRVVCELDVPTPTTMRGRCLASVDMPSGVVYSDLAVDARWTEP